MTWKHLLTAAALIGLAGVATPATAADSMVGTWKLNAAKSKSPYKSGTSVSEAVGDGLKVTVDLVGADGTPYHWSWTAKYDGKDVPVTGKTPYGDNGTVALTRVDANTVKARLFRAREKLRAKLDRYFRTGREAATLKRA